MNGLRKMEESVIYSLRELYHRYGYSQFKMSKFEPYDLYMQNKEFLVSEGVITFTDTDGTLMALKPDVTLSIVKNFRNENTKLQKVCYNENVYRIAGASRSYREIMQTGLECLGDVGMYEISEVLLLAVKSLLTISDRIVLDLSHMGVISDLISDLRLSDTETSDVLRFLGERNKDALISAIGAHRASDLIALMEITGSITDALPYLRKISTSAAVKQLELLNNVLTQAGLADYVQLDFSIISDRNYYNEFVFRGYVEGIPTAVLAGGQYDRLMEKMRKQAKGVGFAVYLDQLELLESRSDAYDVDTLLLYDDSDIAELAKLAETLSETGVYLAKEVPDRVKYRKLVKFQDGRLILLEENG